MTTRKRFLLILPVFILTVSCGDDFTLLAPQSERNVENFYQTDTDFITAINGAYSALAHDDAYGRNYMLLLEMRSDNTSNAGGATGLAESLERITLFNELPDAGEIERTWVGAYRGIARTNTILNRLESYTFTNPDLGRRIEGEALFIRSLFYYNLAVIFGNIPIQLDEIATPSVEINQVSADTIYEQIVRDLERAETLLPISYSGSDVGRATRGAAATLLGLTELTAGNRTAAEAALRRVVDSQQYELVPGYADIWGVSNENNIESIFELQYKSGGQGTGSSFIEYYTPNALSGGVGGGNTPQGLTDNVLATFEEEDERYNGSFALDDEGEPYLSKFDGTPFAAFDADNNFIVFRYADVLLMLAEAVGESSEAWGYIDEVRQRAGLMAPAETLPGTFEEILLSERRKEFVGENKRWPDLLRFDRARAVMADFLSVSENNIRLLYPIPQREIDAAPEQMQQNPL